MSPDLHAAAHGPTTVKIIISGGFGVGKTTMIRAASEIEPLTTEEYLTEVSDGIDSLAGVERKATTTVALDFGRLTFHQQRMVLYLFGTSGQDRFWFTWDDLVVGAVGAIVLVDTRRLADGFSAVGYFEQSRMPFVVAINEFEGVHHRYSPAEVREALEVPVHVPVVRCDARDPRSAITVLLAVVDHALTCGRQHEQPSQPLAHGAFA